LEKESRLEESRRPKPGKIKFNDGREVYTTNLWCQGEIDCPEARAILQDNAVFIWPADDRCLTLDPELPF